MSNEWSKEWPNRHGDFWCRECNRVGSEFMVRIYKDHTAHRVGVAGLLFKSDFRNYEFLGPISPADTEQLVRLRKLLRQCLPYVLSAAEAAKMMDGFKPREHKEHRLAAEILDAVDDSELRAALGVKEGEK